MKAVAWLLIVIVLFMLAGVLPVNGESPEVIFRSPVFVLLLGALAVSSLVCCVRRGMRVRQVGFLLTHGGVVVILAGACIGFAVGERSDFAVPVSDRHQVRELPTRDGGSIDLDFGLTVNSFNVSHYDRADDAGGAVARHYSAGLHLYEDDGTVRDEELTVNHPVAHNGWRIYLMSYDVTAQRYVVLSARRDPGRLPVIGGIWALMIGVAIMCFRKESGNAA